MGRLTAEDISQERAGRRPAALVAFAAAALTLAGGIGALLFGQTLPGGAGQAVDLLEAMQARMVEGVQPPRSVNAIQIEYLGDHLPGWIGPNVLQALGTLLLIVPIGFLFRATRARKDDLRPLGGILLTVGAVTSAIGLAGYAIVIGLDAADFTGRSAAQAQDVLATQNATLMQLIGIIGRFALALALVVIPLNAMRAGLLTRFVGILGIIVGVTVVIPVGIDQIGLLRSSWLFFVGLTLLGKMPGVSANPPAWDRGEMVPWPSQQELRERREAGLLDSPGASADASASNGTGDPDATGRRTSRKRRS